MSAQYECHERTITANGPNGGNALLACCAILVAVLGVWFAHQAKADWLDQAVDSRVLAWFVGHPGLAAPRAAAGASVPAAVLSAVIAIFGSL